MLFILWLEGNLRVIGAANTAQVRRWYVHSMHGHGVSRGVGHIHTYTHVCVCVCVYVCVCVCVCIEPGALVISRPLLPLY